jgi:hypothetical protein
VGKFEIKDSGSRAEFSGGMVRDNAGDKTDFTGSFIGPMWRRWAEHQTKGRAKYPDPEPGVPNWTKAEGIEELIHAKRSLLRHITAYMEGKTDEDHAAAIFFNINLIEYVKEKLAVRESIVLPVVADPDVPKGVAFLIDRDGPFDDPSRAPRMTGDCDQEQRIPTPEQMRAAHDYALNPHNRGCASVCEHNCAGLRNRG